MVGVFTLDMTF